MRPFQLAKLLFLQTSSKGYKSPLQTPGTSDNGQPVNLPLVTQDTNPGDAPF